MGSNPIRRFLCCDGARYYGHARNLKERLQRHKRGQVLSTRRRRPLKLVYYEELNSKLEAFAREKQFKDGKTRKETIAKLIRLFPNAKCQGFNSPGNLCSSRLTGLHKLPAH